jgi:hypothetical protein
VEVEESGGSARGVGCALRFATIGVGGGSVLCVDCGRDKWCRSRCFFTCPFCFFTFSPYYGFKEILHAWYRVRHVLIPLSINK